MQIYMKLGDLISLSVCNKELTVIIVTWYYVNGKTRYIHITFSIQKSPVIHSNQYNTNSVLSQFVLKIW